MEFNVKGIQTQNVTVSVSAQDMIDSIKKANNFDASYNNYLELRDNGLYKGIDVSYHGSPDYEYTLVTNDAKQIRLYKAIIELENALEDVLQKEE